MALCSHHRATRNNTRTAQHTTTVGSPANFGPLGNHKSPTIFVSQQSLFPNNRNAQVGLEGVGVLLEASLEPRVVKVAGTLTPGEVHHHKVKLTNPTRAPANFTFEGGCALLYRVGANQVVSVGWGLGLGRNGFGGQGLLPMQPQTACILLATGLLRLQAARCWRWLAAEPPTPQLCA